MKTVVVKTASGDRTYYNVYDLKADGVFLVGLYNSFVGKFVHMFPLELEVKEEEYA